MRGDLVGTVMGGVVVVGIDDDEFPETRFSTKKRSSVKSATAAK